MKNIKIILMATVILISVNKGNANAQNKSDISFTSNISNNKISLPIIKRSDLENRVVPIDKNSIKEMKANLRAAKIKFRVNSNFENSFKDVIQVDWEFNNQGIVADFKMKDRTGRAFYSKKGNPLSSIVTYSELEMPEHIKTLIKESYEHFGITMVQEIRKGIDLVYLVYLEDNVSCKQIIVCGDDLTVYMEYEKSMPSENHVVNP